ncbi:MAG TPA: 16S rRNA (guanine(527)-N(7))-methyltransferase RsmG [Polyangia bacterium]|nr:16S rRNA (guanine(527)-N(7))-methyltransferase RsmG [Polyangia bacterium]
MQGATKRRLAEGAARLGVPLDEGALAKLDRYLGLLLRWNQRINLTAIVEPDDVVDRHFLDSLAIAPLLGDATTLLDVGSGAGFPGVALAVARPALRVTCIESIQKKVAFLQTLRREVALNVEALGVRLEKLPPDRFFDAVVSRAVWEPAEWVEHGAPFVAPGGLLIAMQTLEQPIARPPSGFTALPPVDYEIAGVTRRLTSFRR